MIVDSLCALMEFLFPFSGMEARFMQQAMLALILLAPITAAAGIYVVNYRMAFFADAVSHSAFAGVALGVILSLDPHSSMIGLAVIIGVLIIAFQRNSTLSSDTVIGVFFSFVIALGLALVSRERSVARDVQQFLYGDILTIGDSEIIWLGLFFCIIMGFIVFFYNKLLYVGVSPILASAHRVNVKLYQYVFAVLLAVVVIFSVWAVGVLLVTAMLIVPAAAARNFSRSAGAMFWWALIISLSSAVSGLYISSLEWANTATGATIVLVSFIWFLVSAMFLKFRGYRRS